MREYKSLEAVQDKQLKPVEASRVKEQHDKNEAQKRKLREYEEMVHVSFQLLSDKVQYKNYLKMIKVRSYLIQPLDIDDLKQIIGKALCIPRFQDGVPVPDIRDAAGERQPEAAGDYQGGYSEGDGVHHPSDHGQEPFG